MYKLKEMIHKRFMGMGPSVTIRATNVGWPLALIIRCILLLSEQTKGS